MRHLLDVYRFLFARPAFQGLNSFVYWCSLRGLGIMNYEDDRVSGEEFLLRRVLAGRTAPVVLDVGANEGRYSRAVRRANPGARIYAFEPHPATYRKLVTALAPEESAHFRPVNAAVGNESGFAELFDYRGEDGSSHASLHRDVIEHLHGAESVAHRVPMVRLDDFAAEHGLGRIDLLKVDTEGNELAALQGLRRHIEGGLVDVIQFEFNEMNVVTRVFFKDFWDFLGGYELYRLLPGGLARIERYSPASCEIFAFQNIVAFRQGARDAGAGRP